MRAGPAAASLVLLALGGCSGSSGHPSAPGSATSLWSARVPYVGDNSRVTTLIDEIGFAGARGYTVELRTAAPPYALAISLKDPEKPFDATDVSGPATLLLGLIANLDEVSITDGQHGLSLTAAAASRDLGHDVKQLGRDRPSLARYLERARD